MEATNNNVVDILNTVKNTLSEREALSLIDMILSTYELAIVPEIGLKIKSLRAVVPNDSEIVEPESTNTQE